MSWAAILILAVGTYAMKAVGPVVLGRRVVPMRVQRLFLMLAVALLAALIALSTLADGARQMKLLSEDALKISRGVRPRWSPRITGGGVEWNEVQVCG